MSEIVRDVSPESLARANENNLASGLADCTRAYGGEVFEEPDLLCMSATWPNILSITENTHGASQVDSYE